MQVFDLEKTSLNSDSRTFTKPIEGENHTILKTASIYGSNASGKSSFVEALAYMQMLVRGSSSKDSEAIYNQLSQHKNCDKTETSEFEVEFFFKNSKYQYGFELDRTRIISEWLYTFNLGKGKGKTILERNWDDSLKRYDTYSPSLKLDKKLKEFLFASTSPTELFLTKGNNLKISDFEDVYSWFDDYLLVIEHKDDFHARTSFRQMMLRQFKSEASAETKLSRLLKSFDLGFDNINVIERKISENEIDDKIIETIEEILERERKDNPELTFEDIKKSLTHITPEFFAKTDKGDIKFDFNELSDGSRKVVDFSGLILNVIEHNRVLVVDEFTDNLHPLLTKRIVDTFLEAKNSSSQLIFTTHDTTLMDMCFQRDQVWIVDKKPNCTSDLVPLSKYKLRKNQSFETVYLAGLIGGVPK